MTSSCTDPLLLFSALAPLSSMAGISPISKMESTVSCMRKGDNKRECYSAKLGQYALRLAFSRLFLRAA